MCRTPEGDLKRSGPHHAVPEKAAKIAARTGGRKNARPCRQKKGGKEWRKVDLSRASIGDPAK
jgi:hypothetical protein